MTANDAGMLGLVVTELAPPTLAEKSMGSSPP
jgi:hypothetical protein